MEAVNLSRKRKLQTEQLVLLPLPKHTCFDNEALLSKSNESCCDSNISSDKCSEIETVKDRNSFIMAEGSEYSTLSGNLSSIECSDEITDESCSSSLQEEMFHDHLELVYGTGKLEEYTENEIADTLFPDGKGKDYNATCLVSSGRWTVNQDSSGQNTRKPTIDQEFEEYFSMLML